MTWTRSQVEHRCTYRQDIVNFTRVAKESADLDEKRDDFDFEGVKFGDGAMVLRR